MDINEHPAAPAEQEPAAPQDAVPPESGAQTEKTSADQAHRPEGDAQTADPGQAPPSDSGQAAPGAPQQIVMDPATGQHYLVTHRGLIPVQPVPQYTQPAQQVYTQTPPVEEGRQPDFTQIIKSVEDFAEGDASVADVVKTLYTETAQDDQFWKGAVVGAAAAVLLTNESVRGAMGKTFGSLFGGAGGAAGEETAADSKPE